MPNFEENRGIKIILGNREHKKKIIFWGTEEQANLFQGNKGIGTSLGGPQKRCQLLLKIQSSLNEHARCYKSK